MLEIEVKYPVRDFEEVREQLQAWGARFDTEREDADLYFNAPDRDFAQTDEALRVRRIGTANFVTYKGPKTDPQTKTRTEVEVPMAPGEEAAEQFGRLLVQLRYRPVAVVRKRRIIGHLQREGFDVEACLDNVAGVGNYVELEIMAPAAKLDAAKAVLMKLAQELGLRDTERRSYLELLLTGRGEI